jgi:hypothetical protein
LQVLVRGSVLLNLCLVLYLSLSAGWNLSSSTLSLSAPYARDIQFFGKQFTSFYLLLESSRKMVLDLTGALRGRRIF